MARPESNSFDGVVIEFDIPFIATAIESLRDDAVEKMALKTKEKRRMNVGEKWVRYFLPFIRFKKLKL